MGSAGSGRQPRSGPRPCWRWRVSRDLHNFVPNGLVHWGWALAAQGQGEEGIAQMRQGLAA